MVIVLTVQKKKIKYIKTKLKKVQLKHFNMTPQDKAWELVQKYCSYQHYLENDVWGNGKQCALIAVDEILNAIYWDYYEEDNPDKTLRFWEDVKKEIEKL